MPLNFTAIDFETANRSPASACAVGLARVVDGVVVERAETLIRPPAGHDFFLASNIQIHGIRPEQVRDAPSWHEVQADIIEFAGGEPFVAHNARFDMGVMRETARASGIPVPETRWADSVRIARSTYKLGSYRLPIAAAAAGFTEFAHHDAGGDAAACAAIVVHAAAHHEARDLDHLVSICAGRFMRIGPEAEAEQAIEEWWR